MFGVNALGVCGVNAFGGCGVNVPGVFGVNVFGVLSFGVSHSLPWVHPSGVLCLIAPPVFAGHQERPEEILQDL